MCDFVERDDLYRKTHGEMPSLPKKKKGKGLVEFPKPSQWSQGNKGNKVKKALQEFEIDIAKAIPSFLFSPFLSFFLFLKKTFLG